MKKQRKKDCSAVREAWLITELDNDDDEDDDR